jgi:hypothetical protein
VQEYWLAGGRADREHPVRLKTLPFQADVAFSGSDFSAIAIQDEPSQRGILFFFLDEKEPKNQGFIKICA